MIKYDYNEKCEYDRPKKNLKNQPWASQHDESSDDALYREAELPGQAMKTAVKELRRLKKMSPQMPEFPMLRHYLELMSDLPWNKVKPRTQDETMIRPWKTGSQQTAQSSAARIMHVIVDPSPHPTPPAPPLPSAFLEPMLTTSLLKFEISCC